MSTKRPAGEPAASASGAPPKKKALEGLEMVPKIGAVASLDELDKKVLQIQNKKLAERLEQRRLTEDDLRKRIEQLEHRQATDDAVLMIINRYWNQLDEDVRVLLQRFDAEAADENEKTDNSGATTSFLAQLSSWDQQEMEAKQGQRVEFSKRAIGKLLLAYDRLLTRHEKLVASVKVKSDNEDKSSDAGSEPKGEKADTGGADDELGTDKSKTEKEPPNLEEVVKKEIVDALAENKRLHNLVTELHERHHVNTLKCTEMEEKLSRAETEIAELKNKIDDLEYDYENSKARVFKLEKRCKEVLEQSKMQTTVVKIEGAPEGVSKAQVSDSWVHERFTEMEECRELAANRLQELEELQAKHQDTVRELEQLRMDLKTLPEAVIVETTEYKCLQSQFSVLYNECMQIKTKLEENRQLLSSSKNAHLRQIEQMEHDELECQKNLRAEVINLEDTLAQCRKEYEMLRIEFEQTLAANEQTGPINREMRNLITSLQNHNHQLKVEIARYKKKLKETQTELSKLKNDGREPIDGPSSEETSTTETKEEEELPVEVIPDEPVLIKEETKEEVETETDSRPESEVIKDLKAQLKKANDSAKEMKLLLDMYKSAPKEQKDKVKLMCAEKKAKQEIEELKNHIRKMQEAERKEKRKLADDDAIKKIRKLEEQIVDLQKQLAAQKQEEEALLNEMEVTGQAFEDMQEQNIRLIQQLREKDDANFKLMAERIKSNQIQKLLKEEKDILEEQVTTVHSQVEAQNVVVRKLEEKERVLQSNLGTVEKELSLRQQAMEMHKRKAIESAQTAADLKLHLDKYTSQLKEAQTAVSEKVASLERELYKSKRVNEELASLRKKLERHKKMEMAETADEVLMEEIREYKEQLTCPSCKVKRKDAVLTKCFHVFCLECLKTRYETRQRKCPKCNAAFGANDFHRIYIG